MVLSFASTFQRIFHRIDSADLPEDAERIVGIQLIREGGYISAEASWSNISCSIVYLENLPHVIFVHTTQVVSNAIEIGSLLIVLEMVTLSSLHSNTAVDHEDDYKGFEWLFPFFAHHLTYFSKRGVMIR